MIQNKCLKDNTRSGSNENNKHITLSKFVVIFTLVSMVLTLFLSSVIIYSWFQYSDKTQLIMQSVGSEVLYYDDSGKWNQFVMLDAEVRFDVEEFATGFYFLSFYGHSTSETIFDILHPWELWRIETGYSSLNSNLPQESRGNIK